MLDNYICALDIGSSKIAACVAKIRKKGIFSLFFETLSSKGIKKGMVIDSIDLISSVSQALKNLKAKSGTNIKSVYANISGQDITTRHSHAVIPLVERGNKIINTSDIQRVTEQALILGSNLEEEIIHQIPCSFAIDSANNIFNPIGLYSHRLEVDLYLVCARLSSIQSLTHVINQAGYEVKDLFFTGKATSDIVFNKELKEGIIILCDIGSDITELLLFKDGRLKDIQILPMGGDDLTLKLLDELKISFDLAEDVKRSYASVGDYSRIKEDKEILIKKNDFYKPIKQKLVCSIVTSKANSIYESLKSAVRKMVSSDTINNFIVTGRTALLEGFLETLENNLEIPVKFGRIMDPKILSFVNKDDNLSGLKYLNYVTALGIICQAINKEPIPTLSTLKPANNLFSKAINKVREIYQEYF